jgi:hypothetical protein
VQPGGVVLCILLFNTPVDTYVAYALNRIFDTTIGVLVALAVSWLLPRGGLQVWKTRIARWRNNFHAEAHGLHPDVHAAPEASYVPAAGAAAPGPQAEAASAGASSAAEEPPQET